MVKFGRHLQFFLDNEHQGSSLYVVPYNDVRALIHDEDAFLDKWNDALQNASTDFLDATTAWWLRIFEGIAHLPEESRGALPEVALRLYISVADEEELQELLSITKQLHSTSLTNAEALRKLVKKFDKEHEQRRMSPTLLPRVYASNFCVGQSTLEAALVVLRTQLHMDDDEDLDHRKSRELGSLDNDDDICLTCNETPKSYLTARREHSRHSDALELRKRELEWLSILLKSIPPTEVSHMVAHRGFHSPRDRSDRRPLENSLSAYETAWTHGIHLCECDVALTKDEKLVLAHDEDFSRLALDPLQPNSSVKVRELTYRQLLSLPLKSGTRPPLLMDVLRSACELNAQLVIEIKPGNSDAATALARMFLKYPQLLPGVAVVMSFDAFAMHNLRREMVQVMDTLQQEQSNGFSHHRRTSSIPTSMSFGNFSVAHNLHQMAGGGASSPSRAIGIPTTTTKQYDRHYGRTDSGENVGMWLSESVNQNESYQQQQHLIPPSSLRRKPSVEKYFGTSPNLTRRPSMDRSRGSLVSQYGAPKLMLLTVAEPPKIPCELWVDVEDLSPVDGWLHSHDGSLDGVYLQFQTKMMTTEGAACMRTLSSKYAVGVWGHAETDPDDWETFHWLVKECRVDYVNTDLPKGFKKIFRNVASGIE